MSNEALTAVAKSDIRPSGRKFVAMALADYADEAWSCFPSVEQLARYTSQGEKTVRDHLDALEEAGVLTRERHRRDDGTLGRYRFKLHRRNLPVADFANGEKPSKPAADLATHNPQLEPSTNKTNTRGTRLPADFVPDLDWAVQSGMSLSQANTEASQFHDYWISKAGAGGVKLDWTATWRSWVRNSLKRRPASYYPPPKQPTLADAFNAITTATEHRHAGSSQDFQSPRGAIPHLSRVQG